MPRSVPGLDPDAYADIALARARSMGPADPSNDLLNLRLILALADGDTEGAATFAERWEAAAPKGYALFQLRTAQLVIVARRNDASAFAYALDAWKAAREQFPQNWNDAALEAEELAPFFAAAGVKPTSRLTSTLLGGASLAWQSDYGQFYLVDAEDQNWDAQVDITDDIMVRRWSRMSTGLIVYTNDCLEQVLDIELYDGEPHWDVVERRSRRAWTQVEIALASFPSRRLAVTSPSRGSVSPGGPFFFLSSPTVVVGIGWLDFAARGDDSGVSLPEVIRIELWPAKTTT
jgi:hypothetical protein